SGLSTAFPHGSYFIDSPPMLPPARQTAALHRRTFAGFFGTGMMDASLTEPRAGSNVIRFCAHLSAPAINLSGVFHASFHQPFVRTAPIAGARRRAQRLR